MAELQILSPMHKDLGGGFNVRRLLPALDRQAVGPFLFFDHFGPITEHAGERHDVRPHPHIGLATVTYLFEGAIVHRDSIGVVQRIEPGAINLMMAGRGIVHSERAPADLVGVERRSHGLQLWMALPSEREEDAPSFQHVAAAQLPRLDVDGVRVGVLVGSAFGQDSPVRTASPTLYLDLEVLGAADRPWVVPPLAQERALYSLAHPVELDGQRVEPCSMIVLPVGAEPCLRAPAGARLVMIGGAPLGRRHIVWNFVSSRRERIVQAQDDWLARRFDPVPGETEFIPLPSRTA
jgi:redox-sensitive bicupin YhaK (pirin superfamily)